MKANQVLRGVVFGAFGLVIGACQAAPGKAPEKPPLVCGAEPPPTVRVVNISLPAERGKPARVDAETLYVCRTDTVEWRAPADVKFRILFKGKSPFKGQDFPAREGRVVQPVAAGPSATQYKYFVIVPGRPDLDPRIIIANGH